MKKRLRFSLTFTCLLFLCLAGKSLFAQFPQTLEIGPFGGITTYQGDINPLKFFNQFGYDYGGLVRYNYDTRWSFRFAYTHALLKGSDQKAGWRPERDLGFQTTVNDFALVAEFNFFDYYTGRREASISPYFFAGISFLKFAAHPYVDDITKLYDKAGIVAPDGQQSQNPNVVNEYDSICKAFATAFGKKAVLGSDNSFSIPFGIGCKMSLTKNIGVTLEWRMHYTLNDGLDNVTGLYPANQYHSLFVATPVKDEAGNDMYSLIGNQLFDYQMIDASSLNDDQTVIYDLTDPTGNYIEGQQRGDASTNDWFGVLNFSITWKIPIPGNTACKIIN